MLKNEWYFRDLVLLNLEGKISEAKDKLLTESSTNVIWATQGKIMGFKALQDKIETELGKMTATMYREEIPEINNLSKAALENFQEDISKNGDAWIRIDKFVGSEEERIKNDLFENGTVGRDMKLAHGIRDGLRLCNTLMDAIADTLQEVKENPSLFDEDEEEQNTIEFPEPELVESETEDDPVEEDAGETSEEMDVETEELDEYGEEEEGEDEEENDPWGYDETGE